MVDERAHVTTPDDTTGTSGTASPSVQMMRLLYGSLVTQLVTVVAELGVADLVADRPRPVAELAASTDTDPDALYRVLRTLAGQGVFTEVTARTFGLTPLAATLRTGGSGSLRDYARFCGLPERQRAFAELGYSVRTGHASFEYANGIDWWSHLAANPQHDALFNDVMGYLARRFHTAVIEAYDLSDVCRLVDVGGGHGHLVAAIARRYPGLSAVVFDQPHVVAGAEAVLADAGVGDRVGLVGGDFFDSVPAGGDVYVLSMVLHDWNDVEAAAILSNVRAAMDPAGRILVIDTVIPDGDVAHFGKLMDIVMMVFQTGRERTEAEFAALFESAGLHHAETKATASPSSVIVATPAPPFGAESQFRGSR